MAFRDSDAIILSPGHTNGSSSRARDRNELFASRTHMYEQSRARDSDAIIVSPMYEPSRDSDAILLGPAQPGSVREKSWKTKICKLLKKGCPNGTKCRFAHSIEELRPYGERLPEPQVSSVPTLPNYVAFPACPQAGGSSDSTESWHVAIPAKSHESGSLVPSVPNLQVTVSARSQEGGASGPTKPWHVANPAKSHESGSSVPSVPNQVADSAHARAGSSLGPIEPRPVAIPAKSLESGSSVPSEPKQHTVYAESQVGLGSSVLRGPRQGAVPADISSVGNATSRYVVTRQFREGQFRKGDNGHKLISKAYGDWIDDINHDEHSL